MGDNYDRLIDLYPSHNTDQAAQVLHRYDWDDSILLYTLKQDGWRKGQPLMVNDVMIRIENANGSQNDLGAIAERIRSDLAAPSAPAEVEGLVADLSACDTGMINLPIGYGEVRARIRKAITALTARQAEIERLREAADASDGNDIWRFWNGRAKDLMERAHALRALAGDHP